MRSKIPKHIIQTWKTEKVPKEWRKCIPSIKYHMPKWSHDLYTDKDIFKFCKKNHPDLYDKFTKYPYGVQRADVFRYLYLREHGGVYMDLDFIVRKPFDNLFDALPDADIYVVESGNIGGYFTNSFIACKPKCKLWDDVIIELKKDKPWWAQGKHLEVMNTTGPHLFDRVVKKYLRDPSLGVKVIVVPKELFTICSVCDPYCEVETSYVKGVPGRSWTGWDTDIMVMFKCNAGIWLFLLIILILLILSFSGPWPLM